MLNELVAQCEAHRVRRLAHVLSDAFNETALRVLPFACVDSDSIILRVESECARIAGLAPVEEHDSAGKIRALPVVRIGHRCYFGWHAARAESDCRATEGRDVWVDVDGSSLRCDASRRPIWWRGRRGHQYCVDPWLRNIDNRAVADGIAAFVQKSDRVAHLRWDPS